MKHLRMFFCVILLITSAATVSVIGVKADTSDLTLDQILAKHYKARGGLDQIKSFQTMQITGKFLSGGGTENPLVAYWKRPNWLRVEMDIQGAHFIKAYGGQDVWVISPLAGTLEPQIDTPLDQKTWPIHADLDGLLVDWQDKDYTLELVGTDEVEGTAVHHLRLITTQDVTIDLYLDSEYFLVIKTTLSTQIDERDFSVDMYYSDFKDVGGVVMPHLYEVRVGGQTVEHYMFEEYTTGVELDETIFAMPKTEGDAATTKSGESH